MAVASDFFNDSKTLMPMPNGSDSLVGDGPVDVEARRWLKLLEVQLDAQASKALRFDEYYRGDHPLPEMPFRSQEKATYYKRKYADLLVKSRTNWMRLVIDALGERLRVEGFRFGDTVGDEAAWTMWQANNLDAESDQVHTEALKSGTSYVSVWPTGDIPLIMPEHPSEVIVAHSPENRRLRAAALKRWKVGTTTFATVYLPGWVVKYRRGEGGDWMRREPEGEEWPLTNPLGAVPIVVFRNHPDLIRGGVSEISDVTSIQDRINATIFGRMLAAEFTASQKRWATGISLVEDPETGEAVPIDYDAAVDSVWMDENPEAKFGSFPEVTLAGFIRAVEADVQHLAAITRTPPHYLLGQSGAFPSGESLKATETGLVAKVKRQHLHFGESWEAVIRLGFAAMNDEKSNERSAETLWGDPESRSEGEHVDAVIKLKALDIPNEALWERANATPQEIKRWKTMAATSNLFSLLGQSTAQVGEPAETV
ncbi:MAG: phage portal protein [Acidimicrobiia bacterium]|nr:phage portal protein [Acidimicrobiia bacterium]